MTPLIKMSEDPLLGGTCETTPRLIWIYETELAAIRHGVDCEFVREPAIRKRMHQAYTNGEAMWMAAAEVLERYRGAQREKRIGGRYRLVAVR